MGDKASAKATMIKAGVPCVPGSEGIITDVKKAKVSAKEIGYPVMLKEKNLMNNWPKRKLRLVHRSETTVCTWKNSLKSLVI